MFRHNYSIIGSREGKLLRSALNEVLNGFVLDDFDDAIGVGRSELQQLFEDVSEFSDKPKEELTRAKMIAFRNALRETLRELGIEEFHTRTGFEFAEGEVLLEKLNRLLGDNKG